MKLYCFLKDRYSSVVLADRFISCNKGLKVRYCLEDHAWSESSVTDSRLSACGLASCFQETNNMSGSTVPVAETMVCFVVFTNLAPVLAVQAWERPCLHRVRIFCCYLVFVEITNELCRVMGATGTGKSTVCTSFDSYLISLSNCDTQFINLASRSSLRVSNGLQSCTDEVQSSREFELGGRKITLLDTPGFDDSEKTDTEILTVITNSLGEL